VSAACRVRPSREFAPAGDLLSCADKKVGKETAPEPLRPTLRFGFPAVLSPEAPAPNSLRSLRSLRSNKRRESVLEACCARGLRVFRSSAGSKGGREIRRCERLAGLAVGCWDVGCFGTPPWRSREAQEPEARAKRASLTDSAQLSDRSERSERREFCAGLGLRASQGTPSEARGDGTGATSLPTFLFAQESRSPARANSGHHSRRQAGGANT
jgi:hypothetical protein